MDESRIIKLEGIQNIRDLGGLTGLDGRKIKKDLLIRSSRLEDIKEDGIRYFKNINLTKIIDFRSASEAAKHPDPEFDGIQRIQIEVIDEKVNAAGASMAMVARAKNENEALLQVALDGFDMSRIYIDFIRQPFAIEGMSYALKLVAAQKEDEAILWHCNGGKDRTGTFAAFLLEILGVSYENIMDDFELTNVCFAQEIEKLKSYARSKTDNAAAIDSMQDIAGVSRKNLELSIAYINENFNSLMDYIRDVLKVTDEEIEQIRDKYLEK